MLRPLVPPTQELRQTIWGEPTAECNKNYSSVFETNKPQTWGLQEQCTVWQRITEGALQGFA